MVNTKTGSYINKIVCLIFCFIISPNLYSTRISDEPPIPIEIDKEFSIELFSNPTTGFGWYIANSGSSCCIDTVSHTYQCSFIGYSAAGGKEIFRFKPTAKGRTKLIFHYRRAWEKMSPALIKEFPISIN